MRDERTFANLPIVVLIGSQNAKRPRDPRELANSYLRRPLSPASLMSCWRFWTSTAPLPFQREAMLSRS
jgi:hypothetical protein